MYALAVLGSVLVYGLFTISFTEWRNRFVRESNKLDNSSTTRAVDSLLNYETVKYFGNEAFEARQYDAHLAGWETARMKTRLSLSALNSRQSLIIAGSVTLLMVMAASQVASGAMTLGERVLVYACLIKRFSPLNLRGFIYQEIREALINIERLFGLLEARVKVQDRR